jgi:hypothetical protein
LIINVFSPPFFTPFLGIYVDTGTDAKWLDIQEEIAMIRSRLQEEESIATRYGPSRWGFIRGAIHEMMQKGMRNRVFLVACAFTLNNSSGASAINYYSPTLFTSLGITEVSLYTGIYGLVKGLFFSSPSSRY